MVRAIASALLVGFSLAPPPLLRHPNGATQSRARYAAETSCVESVRPIPCRLRDIANIYKALFRLPFLCGAKKGLGGEAGAPSELGPCTVRVQSPFNRIEKARSGCLHGLTT